MILLEGDAISVISGREAAAAAFKSIDAIRNSAALLCDLLTAVSSGSETPPPAAACGAAPASGGAAEGRRQALPASPPGRRPSPPSLLSIGAASSALVLSSARVHLYGGSLFQVGAQTNFTGDGPSAFVEMTTKSSSSASEVIFSGHVLVQAITSVTFQVRVQVMGSFVIIGDHLSVATSGFPQAAATFGAGGECASSCRFLYI